MGSLSTVTWVINFALEGFINLLTKKLYCTVVIPIPRLYVILRRITLCL